jgi:hypothetical protein
MMLSLVPIQAFGASFANQLPFVSPNRQYVPVTIDLARFAGQSVSPNALNIVISLTGGEWNDAAILASDGALVPVDADFTGTVTAAGITFGSIVAANFQGTNLTWNTDMSARVERIDRRSMILSVTPGAFFDNRLNPAPAIAGTPQYAFPVGLQGTITFNVPVQVTNTNVRMRAEFMIGGTPAERLLFDSPLTAVPAGWNFNLHGGTVRDFDIAMQLGQANPYLFGLTGDTRNLANSIVITENIAGAFGHATSNTAINIRLTAPSGYEFRQSAMGLPSARVTTILPQNQGIRIANNGASVSIVEGNWGGREGDAGGSRTLPWNSGASGDRANDLRGRSFIDISVMTLARPIAAEPLLGMQDGFVISGVWLIPTNEAQPTQTNVAVRVDVIYDTAPGAHDNNRLAPTANPPVNGMNAFANDAFSNDGGQNANITVGNRVVAAQRVQIIGTPSSQYRYSGFRNNDPWGGNNRSAIIRFYETAPGHWDSTNFWGSVLTFEANQPGVQITNAWVGINRTEGFTTGQFGTTVRNNVDGNSPLTQADQLVPSAVAVRDSQSVTVALGHAMEGAGLRSVDVQFQFALEPGFEAKYGSDIIIDISGTALREFAGETSHVVAVARDAFTVDIDGGITQATVGQVQNIIDPEPISNVRLTENRIGALNVGSEIWVRAVGQIGPFGTFLTGAPNVNVEVGNLLLAPPVARNISGETIYAFRVLRRSTGTPAQIVFSGMHITGFVLPNHEYLISITGTAVAETDIITAAVGQGLSNQFAGSNGFFLTDALAVEVIEFAEFEVPYVAPPGGQEPGGQQPGWQPGGQPGQVPQVPYDAVATVTRANTLPNGAPAIITIGNRDFVSFRFLAENMLGGDVYWNDAHAAAQINAVNVQNQNVAVTFSDADGIRRSVAGGDWVTQPVHGDMINQNETNYIAFNIVGLIFGFRFGEANGTWYIH